MRNPELGSSARIETPEKEHNPEYWRVKDTLGAKYEALSSGSVSGEEARKYGEFWYGPAIELKEQEKDAEHLAGDMERALNGVNDTEEVAAIKQYYSERIDGLFDSVVERYMSEGEQGNEQRGVERSLLKSAEAMNDIGQQGTSEMPAEGTYESMWPFIKENNELVKQDWIKKITPLDSYNPDKPFRLICGTINLNHGAGEHLQPFASASLITESHKKLYRDAAMGFIYSPNDIVASDSQDMNSETYTTEEKFVMGRVGELPVVRSIERVEDEMKKNGEMSEVVIGGVEGKPPQPIGIFYKGERSAALDELIKMNPGLKVIQIR